MLGDRVPSNSLLDGITAILQIRINRDQHYVKMGPAKQYRQVVLVERLIQSQLSFVKIVRIWLDALQSLDSRLEHF